MVSSLPKALRCPAAWGLALVVAAAGAGAAQGGAPAPLVSTVEFAGRANVPEELLRQTATLRPGQPFTAERLEEDRKALLALGFFRAVRATRQVEGDRARVTFQLNEWPRVTHVRVLGNTVVSVAAILAAIGTRVGQVFSAPQLQSDIRAIEELYRQRGYVAHVSDRLLDEAVKSGILRYEILEVAIQDVQVEGGTPAQRVRARRLLTQTPPALYRPEAVAHDQLRLQRMGVPRAAPTVEAVSPSAVRIRWSLGAPGK